MMETRHRMPLHDLPLEQFLTSKTPRKHKRPLSPSRTTLFNPAKRRVLDAEGISPSNVAIPSLPHPVPFMPSNMHTVTPTRPSRLGNGYTSFFDCSTVNLIVPLGTFEIVCVPRELRLLCRRSGVRPPANFIPNRQSNRRPTRSLGTILVSISFRTWNIDAPLSPECPCHLMAMLWSIDLKRTRRMCHSGGGRRSSLRRNAFCLVSMVRIHRISPHPHQRVR